MARRPSHTAVLLHPHASVPEFDGHGADFALWRPYTEFQTTRDLRHVVWPVDLAYGREFPVRRFILDGVVVPEAFVPGTGPERHVATLFEDGSCAIHLPDAPPGDRIRVDPLDRIARAEAKDVRPAAAPDPFGRANLEQAVGILAQPKLKDRHGERVVPDVWTLFRDADGAETVAYVRRGDYVERILEEAFRQMREAENRLLNLDRGKDRDAGLHAVETAKGHIGSLVYDEDGPKHRLQRFDGLNVHVGDKRWDHHFDAIDAMQFSSDGRHLAVVGERTGWRVAIDDRPGPGFDRIAGFRWFGPNQCGYIAFRDGRIWRVTVEL